MSFGNLMWQKNGLNATTTNGFAQGAYSGGANFIGDPKSQNPSLIEALNVTIPTSGMGPADLKSFSVVATGNLVGTGSWKLNLCLDQAAPANSPIGSANIGSNYGPPATPRQPLPIVVASASVSVTNAQVFSFEADVINTNGTLSGTWVISLDSVQVASGSLSQMPGGLQRPLATYLQIGAMPAGSSISNILLAVSSANYTGQVQTLNQ